MSIAKLKKVGVRKCRECILTAIFRCLTILEMVALQQIPGNVGDPLKLKGGEIKFFFKKCDNNNKK